MMGRFKTEGSSRPGHGCWGPWLEELNSALGLLMWCLDYNLQVHLSSHRAAKCRTSALAFRWLHSAHTGQGSVWYMSWTWAVSPMRSTPFLLIQFRKNNSLLLVMLLVSTRECVYDCFMVCLHDGVWLQAYACVASVTQNQTVCLSDYTFFTLVGNILTFRKQ